MNQATPGFRPATGTATAAGWINLSVARRGHQTRPVTTESFGVLRLLHPLYLDDSGQVTYIVVNPGGAYFGETYRFSVEAQAGAHLLLASQGATRIYRTPNDPAIQDIDVTLRTGSRVEYIPDQTIAYRDADFRQRMTIVASPDAQGFFAEVVTPGWDPDDATFTYAGMRLRIDVREEAGRGWVCRDNVRIQPGQIGRALNGIGYLEGHTHLGSILVLGPHATPAYADTVRDTVEATGLTRAGVTRGSRHGVSWLMVRALADSTGALHDMVLAVNELDRAVTTGQARLDLRRY